jgi:hypothetical protein
MDRLGIVKRTIVPLHEIITELAALATGYWEATVRLHTVFTIQEKTPLK